MLAELQSLDARSTRERVRVVVYGLPRASAADARSASDVAHVDSRDALEELLVANEVEIVAFAWEDGLPDFVRRIRPSTKLLHFAAELPTGLVTAIEEGWDIAHVDDEETFWTLLLDRTDARARRPDRRRSVGSTFSHRGAEERFELVDLANGGIGFRVPSGADIEKYLPGARLADATLWSGGAVALDGVSVTVRHVTIDGDGYRVGCAFDAELEAPRAHASIRDRARCAALLAAALRGGGIFVSRTARGSLRTHLDERCATIGDRGIVSRDVFHRLRVGDEAHGAFELGGRAFRFTAVVTGEEPLAFALPEVIEQRDGVSAPPFRPSASDPVRVELETPLLGTHLRVARELSASRIVVDLDEADVLPVGLRLSSITLWASGAPVRGRGRVLSHEREAGVVRCAIALDDLDEPSRIALARFLVTSRFPDAEARAPDFDQVLSFFRDTGFMPPDKERVLAPMMAEVRRTFDILAARPCSDFQSVAYRDESGGGEITGYLSGVRAYSRTFMYQHLAGRRGKSVAGPLILSLTEHLLQLQEYEYFKFFFLKGNPFPTRVLETFGRKVGDPWRCDMRPYAHLVIETSDPLSGPAPAIAVHEAADEDLNAVERYFMTTHRGLLLRADDLTRYKLPLAELDARYRTLGLTRTRRVLVARLGHELLGFALAEISSPGLNLSEGLSSARVFVLPAARAVEDEARLALLRGLQSLYAGVGRSVVFALVSTDDVPSFTRIGAPPVATSLCVTAHASLLPTFFDHVRAAARPKR